MSDGPTGSELRQQIRELMGKATLARVRGDKAQALKTAQAALVMQEQNWEVHEFIGDVLMELNRGADALGSYKRAREINPSRVELEDKVARAAVQRAALQDRMQYMSDVIEGRAPKEQVRKPGHAALFSILLPGMGQYYNGQIVKGLSLMGAYIILVLIVIYSSAAHIRATRDVMSALAGSAIWIGLLAALWIYALADATIHASRTTTSDKTGLI